MLIILMLVGIGLIVIPQMWVRSTLGKYSKVPSSINRTGSEVAREILNAKGLQHVRVETTQEGGDHFDPKDNAVRLSPSFYRGSSLAAVTVAAHECGHAVQHAENYGFMRFRAALFPVVSICQSGLKLLFFSFILTMFIGSAFIKPIALLAILSYAGIFLFQVVTLPVELDASFGRAVPVLVDAGYIAPSEQDNANKILQACAFTYIAAALYSLVEIIRWVYIYTNSRR